MTENRQKTINQINAFISYLPEEERKKLSKKLIRFFYSKANCSPKETFNINLPLSEQEFTDESLLILYYISRNSLKK